MRYLRLGVVAYLGMGLLAGGMTFMSTPARAQVMHDDGITLPWFHSRAQQRARQACMDDLPECRDSVRQQLATEKMITTFAPWIMLCFVIWGAVLYVRRRDAIRDQRRHEAQRHHVREAQQRNANKATRKMDGDREPAQDDPDDDGMGMGMGHPRDRR